MATAIAIDAPIVSQAPSLDEPPSIMATIGEPFAMPSHSQRHIPAPVSIPPALIDSAPADDAASSPNPQPSPRLHRLPPPPIPDFVFPARPSTSAPSTYSRASGRRPKSVADIQERSSLLPGSVGGNMGRPVSRSPALPDFVFNPGASLPPTPSHAFLSPPQSPQSPKTIPVRPGGGGHRRGGSEFVGGSLRSGEAFTFMSTSPTKSESGLASPTLSPLNSPSSGTGAHHGRRGHAHRRSAAISSHDLSSILQPTSPSSSARGSSAPSSPSGFGHPENRVYTFPDRAAADSSTSFPVSGQDAPFKSQDADEASKLETPTAMPAMTSALVATQIATEADATETTESAPVENSDHPSPAPRATPRARVGFSDTLEFIPRPLSLVSSDTSSTMTARPAAGTGSANHSVSGSISSIISLNASISPSTERDGIPPLVRSQSRSTLTESRPSTAGAVLDRAQTTAVTDAADSTVPRRRNSIPVLASVLISTPGGPSSDAIPATLPSPKTPKRWSFFSLDPFIGSATASSPTRASTNELDRTDDASPTTGNVIDHVLAGGHTFTPKPDGPSMDICDDIVDISNEPPAKTVIRKPSSKKKKKVIKSWGILGRKTKPRRKSRRAPTPPPALNTADSDEDSIEAQLDTTATEAEASNVLSPPPIVFVTPSGSPSEPRDTPPSWQSLPSPSISLPDDDASFPMIDLDAALGPFNTPLPRNAEWEAAQRAGGLSKKQLHSAAGMSRFSGPGMHYSHRRAESAPEMPPFNRAGMPRFNSSQAMADVFEEDEEEDEGKEGEPKPLTPDGTKRPQSSSNPPSVSSASLSSSPSLGQPSEFPERPASIDIRVTPTDGTEDVLCDRTLDFSSSLTDDATSSNSLSRRGSGLSGLSDDDKTQSGSGLKSEYSASSLHDDVIVEEGASEFAFDEDGCEFIMESSSDSTINSPARLMKGKELSPVDVSPLQVPATGSLAPVSPYSVAASSTFSAPRSPLSYDANRISTAPSSVTEDNFQSLLLGEPGPEVRISSDIPSLTSSNSTMTRESAVPQVPQMQPGAQPRPYMASRGSERPASFTSSAFGRRRSSLASLHRLISTSHGERSKLSIEVQPDNTGTASAGDSEKKSKGSKAKRLSRMVQFWRGKDETTSR